MRRNDYHPPWLDNLAEDVTMEAAVLNGVVTGKQDVLTLLAHARTLYEFQDFSFIGAYGEDGLVEDYASRVRGEPIANIAIVHRNAAGQATRLVMNHRPLAGVLLFSRLMGEHFKDTPYARYFLSAEQLEQVYPRTELHYAVHVSNLEPLPSPSPLTPPNGEQPRWSPLSSTLIYGATEAVLVDPPVTVAQAEQVADWVAGFGVPLTGIYITHAHGDHWYGTTTLLKRFPDTPVHATEGTIAAMRAAHPDGAPTALFASILPGKLADTPVLAQPVPAVGLFVDGHALRAIEVGHADTDDSTVLHVPSIGLVVAGDVIYNNVHQFVGESADGGLDGWLAAIDTVEALAPRFVVAGHKDRNRPDDPAIIGETRDYLRAVAELDVHGRVAFFERVTERFPDRVNPTIVWLSAVRLFPA